jgi:hypothetical protein
MGDGMTGIERRWLDEDIAKVRMYLALGSDTVPDIVIEELLRRQPFQDAKLMAAMMGAACWIERHMRTEGSSHG